MTLFVTADGWQMPGDGAVASRQLLRVISNETMRTNFGPRRFTESNLDLGSVPPKKFISKNFFLINVEKFVGAE